MQLQPLSQLLTEHQQRLLAMALARALAKKFATLTIEIENGKIAYLVEATSHDFSAKTLEQEE